MSNDFKKPLYSYNVRSFVRYAYACSGCGKEVTGYIRDKVKGNVWCPECKRKKNDEWANKRQAEHDDSVRAQVLEELLHKFEDIDSCEFAMFSLCLIKEKMEEVKGKAE